ncbi:DUF2474 family protein [Comamonas thiooxydans]|nr:DUF2474 family protein [Comamonas thiooxydans]
MKTLVNAATHSHDRTPTTVRQLGWMALIWLASVSTLGAAAWLMRQLMALGGMVDCFVWVALSDATSAELDEMREEFNLHELAVEDASHGHQRPKIEEYGQSLFTVMHLLEPDPAQPGHFNLGEVDVFIGSNYVLSVRNRSKQGFLGVRDRCEKEPELLKHGSRLCTAAQPHANHHL